MSLLPSSFDEYADYRVVATPEGVPTAPPLIGSSGASVTIDALDAAVADGMATTAVPVQIQALGQPVRPRSPGAVSPLPVEPTPRLELLAVPELAVDAGTAPTQIHQPLHQPLHPSPRSFQMQAVPQTTVGVIKGTPLYMAPELWRGELASRRSDVYSMGALMYELCAGDPPHARVVPTELPRISGSEDAPPLRSVARSVNERFAAIIDRCLRRDPAARFSSGEELREALEALQDSERDDSMPEGNPYRGLLAFEAEHRALFFGRSNETGTVLERLRSEAFVLVAADSGVGKSSLCRAGVLPRVEEGALGGGRRWEVASFLPGRHPLQSLASTLAPIVRETPAVLLERLREAPGALSNLLETSLGTSRGLVLFIDQMEELISLSTEVEAEAVGTALGGLTERLRSVRLLGTARSDFLARLATLPVLGNDLSRALYLLRPLSRDKLRDVIVAPAEKKGVHFESDGLVETLIDATVHIEGALPLLQFALAELWDAHKDSSITAMALADIGGVSGALARHADHVLLSLPEDQRLAARRILLQLVTLEGTRARRRQSKLLTSPASRPALEALLRGRLLTARDIGGEAVYEVAHEALIKGWSTLRLWLDEHAESRAVRQSLERATADWMRLGRAREALWGTRQLAQTSHLESEQLTPQEAEFITISQRQVQRSRHFRRSLFFLLPIAILLPYLALKLKTRSDLNKRVEVMGAQGQVALRAARESGESANAQRRRAFAAFDAQSREDGEKEWARVRQIEGLASRSYTRASQLLESALTLDQGRDDLRELLGEVLYDRALRAEREGAIPQRDDLLQRLALYDPSRRLGQRFNASGQVQLQTEPRDAAVTIAQYVDIGGRKQLVSERDLVRDGARPGYRLDLDQGSYLLTLRAAGRYEVRYPFQIDREEKLDLKVELPEEGAVPQGFVYVPPGRFLFGTSTDDTLRQTFLFTVPIHPVSTGAYLIAEHETTYSEWIEYLRALPAAERANRVLKVGQVSMVGALALVRRDGLWRLTLQLGNHFYRVQEDEPLVYEGRSERAVQNWLRLPVSGITRDEAVAYAAWLDKSGKLPGARLCTEYEWERAARGADEREFPTGNQLEPTDANFDLTYGKSASAMGPDQVGVHRASRSPFGVDDLAGNVFEWTTSSLDPKEAVARGGGYSYGAFTCRSTNRTILDPSFRDLGLGVRICASWPMPRRAEPILPHPPRAPEQEPKK